MEILLALDGTVGCEDLIGEVLAQAWPAGSRFTVLHVQGQPEEDAQATGVLAAAVFALSESGWQATRHVREGDARSEILTYAEEHQPDLIVMGARRRSNVGRFVLGSVSAAVVRHANCSVQIVRPRVHEFRAERSYRVLLATDGSAPAWKAAEAVATRPWPAGTEVRVVSVVELIEPPTLSLVEPGEPDFPTFPDDFAEAQKAAREMVAKAAKLVRRACLNVSEEIPVVSCGAKGAILDEAERWDADCIFVGSHGVRGLDRVLLGSVSEAVAMHATCSVEVVR